MQSGCTTWDSILSCLTLAPSSRNGPAKNSQLNRFRAGFRHFCSCFHKWGMASSEACECGPEEQSIGHAVFYYTIHQPPHELCSLVVEDDETIEWLLMHTLRSNATKQWIVITGSNDEEKAAKIVKVSWSQFIQQGNYFRFLSAKRKTGFFMKLTVINLLSPF